MKIIYTDEDVIVSVTIVDHDSVYNTTNNTNYVFMNRLPNNTTWNVTFCIINIC